MSCAESLRLIAGAMEGRVAPQALDAMVDHLEQCDRCRFEAEMQRAMQQIVASRPDEPLPDGLAKRIAERLDREGPIVPRAPTDCAAHPSTRPRGGRLDRAGRPGASAWPTRGIRSVERGREVGPGRVRGRSTVVGSHERNGCSSVRVDAAARSRRLGRGGATMTRVDGIWLAAFVPRPLAQRPAARSAAAPDRRFPATRTDRGGFRPIVEVVGQQHGRATSGRNVAT